MTSNSPSSQNQPSFIVTYDDILGTIPGPDQEALLHLLIETQQNILACPRLIRSYAISSLPEDPSDESQAIQTRMMEVHRYLRESPPNIRVKKGGGYAQVKHNSHIDSNGDLYRFNDCYIGAARQEMKWEIHIDQKLFDNWITLKKQEIEGIISTYESRKLHLTTFIIKVILVHEVAHIVHATFSDGPSISSEEFRGQNVGISAEVALTDDQGGVVAVFEEWTGIHHVALAGKHNEHYITQDDAVDLARIAEGQWEDFPVFPQTPPRGNFTRMFRYFHDSMPVGEQEGQLLEEDWQERLAQRVEEESGGKLHVFVRHHDSAALGKGEGYAVRF